MTSTLIPSNPEEVMVIRDVVPKTITTLSVPFSRFGKIKIGGRGTIVRLQSGALAVFSPVALTGAVKEKVTDMGEVKYIIALDYEHHIFLGPWHDAYPNAKVLGPEGLPEKRQQQQNEDVPFAHVFSKDKPVTSIDADFDSEFDYEYVYAHQNKEIAFNHRPTKTLIQADLLFNLPATEQYSKTGISATSGVLTKIFASVGNIHGDGQKRLLWYGTSSKDRADFARSVEKINKWDFGRLIPCHGDVIENGKPAFQKVFQWYLDLANKSS